MRGGALPPALLFAAFAFALSYAPRRTIPWALALAAIMAVAASFTPIPSGWQDGIFLGCWISVVVAALCVHLPGGVPRPLALALAANSGFWAGVVIAGAGTRLDLLKSLPVCLLCLPGAWLVATGRGIAIKVAASWLIAVSLLAATLQMIPTPGYKPDHMD
jgi:hypothetical protein